MNIEKSSAFARLQLTQNHLTNNFAQAARQIHNEVSAISSISFGSKYTTNYKNYALNTEDEKILSYFHDIPLDLDKKTRTANFVVEVPRWLNAKFEIDTKQPRNPIVQDVKGGQVRFVRNLFPYNGYIHNYGAFPQTWEDPTEDSGVEGLVGDGDPLDVCEIGASRLATGTVKRVKILGSIALVDDGELDWKVIVVSVDDELAEHVHDVHDVLEHCPGLLEATRQWFKDYKKPDGKAENAFALKGEYLGAEETIKVIEHTHGLWRRLISGENPYSKKLAIGNVTQESTPGFHEEFKFNEEMLEAVAQPDAPIPREVEKIFYYHKLG